MVDNADEAYPKVDPEEAMAILEKGSVLFKKFGCIKLNEATDMDMACLSVFTINMLVRQLGLPDAALNDEACNGFIKLALKAAYNKGLQDAKVP